MDDSLPYELVWVYDERHGCWTVSLLLFLANNLIVEEAELQLKIKHWNSLFYLILKQGDEDVFNMDIRNARINRHGLKRTELKTRTGGTSFCIYIFISSLLNRLVFCCVYFKSSRVDL